MVIYHITAVTEGILGDKVVFKAMSPYVPRISEEVNNGCKTYKVKRVIYDFDFVGLGESNKVKLILE